MQIFQSASERSKMKHLLALSAALLALASGGLAEEVAVVNEPFSIAAFNVQRFGITKMNKPDVMKVLTDVLSRYDITLVQEIVDSSETAIYNLTERVAKATGLPYKVSLSGRVGRGSYEQYGYVYRSDRVSVIAKQLYPETNDVFAREPYIVKFGVSGVRDLDELTLIGIHTQPSAADKEIDALSDVLDYAVNSTQIAAKNVALLGDFNAGCSYVTSSEWSVNRLKHREDVTWEIADHIDTTVSSTNCAYDRIVLRGDALRSALVDGSAGPFRYEAALNVSEELTEDVSDHYPVQFQLKPRAVPAAESYLQTLDVFSVTDTRGVSGEDVKALAAAAGSDDTASYDIQPLFDASGALTEVRAEFSSYKMSGTAILETLEEFQARFPNIVTPYQLGLLRYKEAAGGFSDPTVYDQPKSPRWYARVTCPFAATAKCRVAVGKRTLVA